MFVSDRPGSLPFPADCGLSWSHYDLLRVLGMMPWSSAGDLVAVCESDRALVHRRLWELNDAGYVSEDRLGCSRPRVSRWRAAPAGLEYLRISDGLWCGDWALSRLLELLPQVEWFYPAAGSFRARLGDMVRFRWFRGVAWDAAALYQRGWVAFFWSGLLQTESKLRETFRRLGADLQACSMTGASAFPGVLCFVVGDAWQRELLFRAARGYGLEDRVQAWCVDDGSVSGCREPLPGQGWVGQVLEGGGLGNWTLASRLESSEWAGGGGVTFNRLLDKVMEWPGVTGMFLARAFGASWSSGRLRRFIMKMRDEGYLKCYPESGLLRYRLEGKAMNVLGRRDRVNVQRFRESARHTRPASDRGHLAHEDGVMGLMGGFYGAGLKGAAGWRSWEHLGRSGGIAPDGLVYLEHGPYGPGWHYVEYELRARGRGAAARKLRGYLSPRRGDRWPLLLVVRNEGIEGVFQELGKAGQLRMLTSTVERVKGHGAAGTGGCWSMYGVKASLG